METLRQLRLFPRGADWPEGAGLDDQAGVLSVSQIPPVPSERHLLMLRLMAEGYTVREAAAAMGVSFGTAKNRMAEMTWMLKECGWLAPDQQAPRAGVVGVALRLGWIS